MKQFSVMERLTNGWDVEHPHAEAGIGANSTSPVSKSKKRFSPFLLFDHMG